MNLRWRLAVRDFWRERGRTSLAVLAIALGIAGFTGVMSSYAILTRALNEGYLATNPASATLRTDRIDDALLAAVLADPRVVAAEGRRSLRARIKAGPAQWRNLLLFVVPDLHGTQLNRLNPERGAWPPATGEILVERDAMQVARARIGDDVRVRTRDGQERVLRLAGTLHDVGQAQARMENIVYGYVTPATLALLGEEPYLDELKILVADRRMDRTYIEAVTADIERLLTARGHSVRGIEIPLPGEHPHAAIMGMLLLSMSSFGLFVLVLSAILVANLLRALMAAQVRQIGVMKAIGGTRAQIAGIYLGRALLMGLAAVVVGLPAGLWGGRVLSDYEAVFLNFDIDTYAVPAWVLGLAVVLGLLVPLAAAARPVWRGTAIGVHEALSDFGVAATSFGVSRFDRWLAGIGGLSRPVLLSLRNGFRQRRRLVSTLIALSAGGLFFMAALNVRASMIATLDGLFATRDYQLQVDLGTAQSLAALARAVQATAGVRHGEGWHVTDGLLPAPPGEAAPNASHQIDKARSDRRVVVIAPPIDTRLLHPRITAGRMLQPGDEDAVVVNSALAARRPEAHAGGTLTLRLDEQPVTWRVVGVAREPFSPPTAYIPAAFVARRRPDAANSLRLALDRTDSESIDVVRGQLDASLAREGIRAMGSLSQAESRTGFDQHMLMIYRFLVVMAAIVAGVGGLGLMTTMSLNVLERRREMGILRAIGATPRTVGTIVAAEALAIAVAAWLLAALSAWPLTRALGNLLASTVFQSGLDVVIDPRGLAIWLAVSVALALAACLLPAWRAARLPVREAISYE